MITKKQFLADVLHEATVLRNIMTDDEKKKLDFYSLDPNKQALCIYGQATGDCESNRAKVLMDAACVRMTDTSQFEKNPADLFKEQENIWDKIRPMINGSYTDRSWTNSLHNTRIYDYLSMIETYICLDTANNKDLIAYIKGEIAEVKL